jgi:membrane protease subunit HflC
MNQIKSMTLLIIAIAIIVFFSTVYTIDEGTRGLLLRLGDITLNKEGTADIKLPGLHFKWPFINTVRILDIRMQTLEIESTRIVTKSKKDVLVDSYVKWRINDLSLYYTRTGGNELVAESLLKQNINNGLSAEFGTRTIQEVVSGERLDIMKRIQEQTTQSAKELGIEIVDVRIKGIDLPSEVSSAVFDRMRAERERVATEHRAKGRSESESIRAKADAAVTIIKATAESDARRIMGEGDALAAQIYAEAYKKNPEFYAFLRSISAYQAAFKNKNDILILKPDGQFFQYFNMASGTKISKPVSH